MSNRSICPLLLRPLLLILPLFTGCGGLDMERANANARPGTGFLIKSTAISGDQRKYGVYIPQEYTPGKRLPVVVFLHGLLEGGSSGTGGMSKGLGPVIADHPDRFPCIVIFPQSGGSWSSVDAQDIALADLDAVQKEYGIDPDRVVLTGVSTGGYGVWALAARHPERFAALVPMCGDAPKDEAPKLARLPIWCFHSTGDFLVGAGPAREMCTLINAAGGSAKFTEVQSMDHNISPEAYANEELSSWMLSQRRATSHASALKQ